MRDFIFGSEVYKFRSYGEVCKLAKKCGVVPLDEPTQKQIDTLQGMIDRTMFVEAIARWNEELEKSARIIDGFVIYKEEKQKENLKKAYAFMNSIGTENHCIIGISVRLLNIESNEFRDLALLHECAHAATHTLTHDEQFAGAYDDRIETYFTWPELIEREDGTDSRRRTVRRTY